MKRVETMILFPMPYKSEKNGLFLCLERCCEFGQGAKWIRLTSDEDGYFLWRRDFVIGELFRIGSLSGGSNWKYCYTVVMDLELGAIVFSESFLDLEQALKKREEILNRRKVE